MPQNQTQIPLFVPVELDDAMLRDFIDFLGIKNRSELQQAAQNLIRDEIAIGMAAEAERK